MVEKSILSDHAPVLTLEDLSPSGSLGGEIGNERSEEVKSNNNYYRQHSSLCEIRKSKDFDVDVLKVYFFYNET